MSELKAFQRLIESLCKLPSIGPKSAERMAFKMLEMSEDDLKEFADAILNLKTKIHYCPVCGNLTEDDICSICKDETRDQTLLMVVSFPKDLIAFEKAETFNGVYHVLGGTISISQGKSIDDLAITPLLEKIKKGVIKEVIIATNPTIEGETTALYLAKIIAPLNVKVTRLAYGLPIGGNLDYTDALTLAKAVEGRRKI